MNDLKVSFANAGYPKHMVENISNKVLQSTRSLERKRVVDECQEILPIRIVSTFGSDTDLVSVTKKYEPHLSRTRSFSESDNQTGNEGHSEKPVKKIFQFVKKTGSSLRNRLVKVKQLALGSKHGATKPCNQKNCQCCKMVPSATSFKINGKMVKTSPGFCSTYNIIYLVLCKLCGKAYIGRSTRPLRTRIGEHRRAYYQVIEGRKIDITNDDFSIGCHLFTDHGLKNRCDFNNNCNVCIIDNPSPNNIELKEHQYIHLLKTLRPLGLNTINPFKIPLFH